MHRSLGGTSEEPDVALASFFLGDFVLKWTSEIYSSCLERSSIFCPKAQHCSCCCESVRPGAEYFAYVALIDYLLDLGPQLWNPPFSSYMCHCVYNCQVHYLLVRMGDKFLAKQPSFNVYGVVTGNPSTAPQDVYVVLD